MSHGVGIIGAGPGVAALHLPTLARLPEDFHVAHIADGGSGRAEALAARTGSRSSSSVEDLLADPTVEVVAVCSPPALHAEQVLASVAAGKRIVFCEKPIATTEADAISVIEACRSARVALVVGTNHLFDEAWGRAKHHLTATGGPVRAISVTVALPPNGRYHDVVTELLGACSCAYRRPGPARARGRGIRRPAAHLRTRRPRPAAAARPRARLRAGRLRAGGGASRLRRRVRRLRHPDPARDRDASRRGRRALATRYHHRRRAARSVVPSGVRPRGKRRRAGPVRRRTRHRVPAIRRERLRRGVASARRRDERCDRHRIRRTPRRCTLCACSWPTPPLRRFSRRFPSDLARPGSVANSSAIRRPSPNCRCAPSRHEMRRGRSSSCPVAGTGATASAAPSPPAPGR